MPASIKNSFENPGKTIVVLNGRIKVGDVIDNKIVITKGVSKADMHYVEKLARKKGMEIIQSRGGARPGAGRPKKEPTKTLSYRVPENTAWIIDSVCRTCIADLQNRDLSGDFTGSVNVTITIRAVDESTPESTPNQYLNTKAAD